MARENVHKNESANIQKNSANSPTLWTLPRNFSTIGRNKVRDEIGLGSHVLNAKNDAGGKFLKLVKLTMEAIIPKLGKRDRGKTKFHQMMASILFVGQMFALLPVVGITNKSPNRLRFKWFSWRMLYSVISIIGIHMIALLSAYRLSIIGLSFHKSASLVFYACTGLTTVVFLRLAQRWPKVIRHITITENTMSKPLTRSNLKLKCFTICYAILFLAAIEHILSIIAGIQVATDCSPDIPPSEAYFKQSFPQIFNVTKFNYWKAAFFEFANIQATFNWNFMDIFIIVISLYLIEKFRDINTKLIGVKEKYLSETFWRIAREEFARLSLMVKVVDRAINEVVILSFANNLFFICLQLFNSLKPLGGTNIHTVYFLFSFIFLMGRTLAVSLFAARVNTISKESTAVLYAVPTPTYQIEVERFLQQVISDDIALTGMGFFNVTKGLVLTVAGTIVTYELVLVQFDSGNSTVITKDEDCRVYSVAA